MGVRASRAAGDGAAAGGSGTEWGDWDGVGQLGPGRGTGMHWGVHRATVDLARGLQGAVRGGGGGCRDQRPHPIRHYRKITKDFRV